MAVDPDVAAGVAEAEAQRPAKKRKRDAYLGLWVNRSARDKLDALAQDRGISRSEMARTVFGYGLAAMGVK